jgi:methylenetetrahydrofolate reductase (NADPH)
MNSSDSSRLSPWQKSALRDLMVTDNSFLTVVELVNSRGVITERRGSRVILLARELAQHPHIHALSITDNPGGNAVLSADILGTDLISRGQEVIIHLSCKDWNRNALQSHAWKLASEGFDNILALSGDCPTSGYGGRAAGVFDTDSVGLLKMLSDMNSGMETRSPSGRRSRLEKTRFFSGAVVNNFKRLESEVMPQYFKLAEKIRAGADFIIQQIGYNARKQDELLRYMELANIRVPVLANVYVLSRSSARYFSSGRIPGVTVSPQLLARVEKEAASPDKGKAFLFELAARQCAIAKGLGYGGAYLGGHLEFGDYDRILELSHSYGSDDWKDFVSEVNYDLPEEFYFFEPDPATGLNSAEVNRRYRASRKQKRPLSLSLLGTSFIYRVNRRLHNAFFAPGHLGFRAGRAFYGLVERMGGRLQRCLHLAEQVVKVPAFGCRDCGDCSLPDIAYLCPESQCAKNQRNGPCGGTRDGKCEVGDKQCIWVRAYDRLKAFGEEEGMLHRPVVYRDDSLVGTSAWANTFLERDHHGRARQSSRERQARRPVKPEDRVR